MQYLLVKNMYMTFAVVTILLFNTRLFLLLSKPERPLAGTWKVLPHLNGTILLFVGLWLMRITHFTPFGNVDWLGVKTLPLLVYIGLGVVVMRAGPCPPKLFIAYLLAMACADSIVHPAMYKPSWQVI